MSWNDLRKGRYSQNNGEYFVTFNTQNRYPYFKDFNVAQLFCQQIQVNETQFDCVWLAWVLMPDHFHGLVRLESDQSSLSSVIRSLKGGSAKQINRSLMKQGRLWQPSFYDRALRRDEDRKNIARYIVANPLRKGLVKSIRNYPYWNAIYL